MVENDHKPGVPEVGSLISGLPWVIMILVFAFASWLVWERFFQIFMDPTWAQYAALGMGPQGALVVTFLALGETWPLQKMQGKWKKGICLTALSLAITVIFWLILGSLFKVNLEVWAFPIIATSWFFIALTSFIGADAHLKDIPALRRMFLNFMIVVAGTVIVTRTIVWIPPFWFGFIEAIIITGGFSYYFRHTKQPVFSILSWSLLVLLTSILITIATYLGFWTFEPEITTSWLWNIGAPSAEFGVWFALTGGFNFAVLACTQCWPFSRIKQPWGTPIAMISIFIMNIFIAWIIIKIMQSVYPPDVAQWQATIMAWQTVFWGWAWVYFFDVGQKPYLWAGQKSVGTWEDIN